MSIRLRLTLLFTVLLATVGLLWGVGLVGGLRLTLRHIAESDVQTKLLEIDDYLQDLDAERRARGDLLSLGSFDALPRALSDDGMYLQLTALDGIPLNRSPNLGAQRLPTPKRTGLSQIALHLPRLSRSPHVLMGVQALVLPERGTVGWVQVGHSLQQQEQTVRQLAVLALGGWVLFVSMAFVVGYYVMGRTLSPIVAMTEEVRGMRQSDLHHRLNVHQPPRDEIERLGMTFNSLFERLESAFEAQRRFVADASHELKNPLTAIIGNLRLIRARGPEHPEQVPTWAEAAQREAERLGQLVESLLALAEAGDGKLTLERVTVDLARVARDVAEEFHAIAPRVFYQGSSEPVRVVGDSDRLKQVVINLVDNAVRATRQGGEVRIGLERKGDRVRLTVEDTGIGMAPEVLSRIFDRFYRVNSARDRAHGGTGLGLAITAALVEDHQGRIAVSSTEGKGTRFEVELPAQPGPTA